MKTGYTDITVILDRSGSMSTVKSDTIGGFNTFLEEQKKAPGNGTFTLVQFDDQYQVDYLRVPLADVKPLDDSTYVPRGWTALLDAIGKTVNTLGETYAAMTEDERPENVVLVIQTDGAENHSREFKTDQIKAMLERQAKDYNWQIIYLGANQDAFAVGAAMGIRAASTMNYAGTGAGTRDALLKTSDAVSQYRASNSSDINLS
jgi:hypothetical protein